MDQKLRFLAKLAYTHPESTSQLWNYIRELERFIGGIDPAEDYSENTYGKLVEDLLNLEEK